MSEISKKKAGIGLLIAGLFLAFVTGCSQAGDRTSVQSADQLQAEARNTEMPGGRLTGVNWFGFETGNFVAHGLWSRDYRSVLQQISDLGFNCVRIPWCNEMLTATPTSIQINEYGVDAYTRETGLNAALEGLSSIEVLDKIIEHAGTLGLKIILDNHSRKADGYMNETLWYTDGYSEDKWIEDWKFMTNRYKQYSHVVGADLNNEPHGNTGVGQKPPAYWGSDMPGYPNTDWRAAAVKCGKEILKINPNILIMIEGVEEYPQGETYWWGGNLRGVKDHPITELPAANVVYSPHEYGPEVHPQTWFTDPSFPGNMAAIWDKHFWFIYKENIAPLLFGEFGIKEESAADSSSTSYIWFTEFMKYVGYKSSWTFWCMNPNSGDTGGILQDDWVSVNPAKYSLIEPYLAGKTPIPEGEITPTEEGFDLNPLNQEDIAVTLIPNGTTFLSIKDGSYTLVAGTDYTKSGNNIVIQKEYLATKSTGFTYLTFDFNSGTDPVLTIVITDTTQSSDASISPTSATFDMADPDDITITVTPNGNSLVGIMQGSSALTVNTDYTVSGNTVTIKQSFLSAQSGTVTLTFDFDSGIDPQLTITIREITAGEISVESFNSNTADSVNTLDPRFRIKNNGPAAVTLENLTLRYYYTADGFFEQAFWCDHAAKIDSGYTTLTASVAGAIKSLVTGTDSDYYLEISFDSSAGQLNPGGSVEIQVRVANTDWSNFTQSNDYSFNDSASSYVEWSKVTAYQSGSLIWGIEP